MGQPLASIPEPYPSAAASSLLPGEQVVWEGASQGKPRLMFEVERAFYVLTNHRAFVITPHGRYSFTTDYYDREALRAATVVDQGGGSGDIVLRRWTLRSGGTSVQIKDGFVNVADVGAVADLVRSVAERSEAKPPPQGLPQGASIPEVPEHLRCAFEQHLEPGERVLWQYQPSVQTTLGSPAFSIFAGFGGLALSAVCVYWLTKMPQKSEMRMLLICGIMALFGLMSTGLLGWGLWSLYRLREVLYAVTDRRAIVMVPCGLHEWRIYQHRYAAIRSMQVYEDARGSGSIRFDFGSHEAVPLAGEAFVGIPRVREVALMIEYGRVVAGSAEDRQAEVKRR